jgi:hypothetical protein
MDTVGLPALSALCFFILGVGFSLGFVFSTVARVFFGSSND